MTPMNSEEIINWWRNASTDEKNARVATDVMGLPVYWRKDLPQVEGKSKYADLVFPCVLEEHSGGLFRLWGEHDLWTPVDDSSLWVDDSSLWNPITDLNQAHEVEEKAIERYDKSGDGSGVDRLHDLLDYVTSSIPFSRPFRADADPRNLASLLLVSELPKVGVS